MDKKYFIKLTQAVYRTTERFPEGESLKFKIREKANEILTDLVLQDPQTKEATIKAIDLLESYFEVARFQNWVNPLNFMLLEQEYDKVVISLKETHNAEHKIQEEVPEQEDADKVLEEREEVPEEPKKEPKESIKKQDKSIIILPQEKPQKELIDRHKKIIDFLKQNDHAQVWQLMNILPNVSKRTVRRDFDFLVGQNLVH
jgi:hypothetical protein